MPKDSQIGADCSGRKGSFYSHDKICAVGQYCNSKILKCVNTNKAGNECDEENSCEFGTGCFEDPKTGKKSCKYLFSIPDGE